MRKAVKSTGLSIIIALVLLFGMSVAVYAGTAEDAVKDAIEGLSDIQSDSDTVMDSFTIQGATKNAGISNARQVGIAGDSVTVSWSAFTGASYYLYAYYEVDSTASPTYYVSQQTTIKISGLKRGTLYNFAVVACDSAGNNISEAVGGKIGTLTAAASITETACDGNSYQLSLTSSNSTHGYRIVYQNCKTKKTKTKYATTTKPILNLGRKYAFKVTITPYTTVLGKNYYAESTVHYAMCQPKVKGKLLSRTSAKFTWGKVKGASSYTVYVKRAGSKKWQKVTTTRKNYCTVKKLKYKKNAYIRVIVNKKVSGKTCKSPNSEYYKFKIK